MEEKGSSLLTLPRRPYNRPVNYSKKMQKTCVTNYFGIDLGGKMTSICQFSIDFEPVIPQDSKELLFQLFFIQRTTNERYFFCCQFGKYSLGKEKTLSPLKFQLSLL